METWGLLFDIVLLLGGCIVVGGLFARFGQSPMVGYLLAGMLMGGPGSLHIIHAEHAIEQISELGVALLLFSLGLEFSFQRLRSLGARALLAGALQVILTTLFAAAVAMPFTSSPKEAIAIGAMVSLSSTACVLRVMMERAEVETPHGRNTLAVLLVQDVAVVPLAILMTLLSQGGTTTEVAWDVGRILLTAAGLIVGLYIGLNQIAVRVFGTLTLERNRELTMVLAIVVGLGSACLAAKAGVSPSLGAFIAGMFLGSSQFASQIRADVSSLRTVLLTLFFGAAGMMGDPIWFAQNLPLVLGVTLLIVVGKMGIIWGILRNLGQPAHVAAATGICLAQIGEFAFVLGSIGQQNGVLSEETYELMVSATIATLFLSPYLVPQAVNLGIRLARLTGSPIHPHKGDSNGEAERPDVLIIGFGPSGQMAAEPFLGRPEIVHVVDLSQRCLTRAMEMGFEAHRGDAAQAEILEHVHVATTKAVVITIPDHDGSFRILNEVRRLAPHAHIIVRSRHHRYTLEYESAGASVVVGDEEEVGAALGKETTKWLSSLSREGDADGHEREEPELANA
ncbi:cation:proton antiporter [Planctomicrobium sp. SH661]|uniref:cation:proton antiporter n=1 Tax=Planctomicrobium sp. SH661 TaxID=3448124 RepID=UPI003F5BD097